MVDWSMTNEKLFFQILNVAGPLGAYAIGWVLRQLDWYQAL